MEGEISKMCGACNSPCYSYQVSKEIYVKIMKDGMQNCGSFMQPLNLDFDKAALRDPSLVDILGLDREALDDSRSLTSIK